MVISYLRFVGVLFGTGAAMEASGRHARHSGITASEETPPSLILTTHAREQMQARSLNTGDLLFLLKHGFVYCDRVESTRPGYFKYAVESRTPNSGNRTIRAIVIQIQKEGM